MTRHHPIPEFRSLRIGLAVAVLATVLIGVVRADSTTLDPDASRFDRLEEALQAVVEENQRLSDEVEALRNASMFDASDEAPAISQNAKRAYSAGYDAGFVIRPGDFNSSPFSLRINNQNTFRFAEFSRDATSWVDSAGNTNPIFDSNNFLIPRGRLILSGNAMLPELSYLLNIDYNSVTNNPIGFRAYVLSYRFSRDFQIHAGQNKVPGTREWLISSWAPQEGPDRSMATTFFRPSLSQGVWFTGEPRDGFYYHTMLCNGFNTLNVTPDRINDRYCWSSSVWWEPWGDFGPGYCDIEDHEQLAVRVGSCYTFSRELGSQAAGDSPENSSLRLSDGTIITQLGALAPGLTLQRYSVALTAFDLSLKFRGLSLSTEWYLQELGSLEANGALPFKSTRAHGGFLQGGYFVLPQKVELYSRGSYVAGAFGEGTEVAGGVNWFPVQGKSNLRYTFDAACLNHSPADQNRTGFVAGQTGLLIRTQFNMSF